MLIEIDSVPAPPADARRQLYEIEMIILLS